VGYSQYNKDILLQSSSDGDLQVITVSPVAVTKGCRSSEDSNNNNINNSNNNGFEVVEPTIIGQQPKRDGPRTRSQSDSVRPRRTPGGLVRSPMAVIQNGDNNNKVIGNTAVGTATATSLFERSPLFAPNTPQQVIKVCGAAITEIPPTPSPARQRYLGAEGSRPLASPQIRIVHDSGGGMGRTSRKSRARPLVLPSPVPPTPPKQSSSTKKPPSVPGGGGPITSKENADKARPSSSPPPPPPPPPGNGPPPPPPPPGGGPPPPPPPGGLRKVDPLIRRRLHWVKLPPHKTMGTVFGTLPDVTTIHFPNENDLKAEFCMKRSEAKQTKNNTVKAASTKSDVPHVMDQKRANNIAIVLRSGLKMPYADIRKAILLMDFNTLTSQHLESLLSILPTSDELDLLSKYHGDPSLLNEACQFFVEIRGIPRGGLRLEVMLYRSLFTARTEEIFQQLDVITSATEQSSSSPEWRKVLMYTLAIGNFLNNNMAGAKVKGFKLETVLKLKDTKSFKKNSFTLLHLLCTAMGNNDVPLTEQLKSVPKAARLSLDEIRHEIALLNEGHTRIEREIVQASCDVVTGEPDLFKTQMFQFSADAQDELESLSREFDVVKSNFVRVVSFYGEDLNVTCTDFFGTLSSFIEYYSHATNDNLLDLLVKERKEKSKAGLEASRKQMAERRKKRAATVSSDNILVKK